MCVTIMRKQQLVVSYCSQALLKQAIYGRAQLLQVELQVELHRNTFAPSKPQYWMKQIEYRIKTIKASAQPVHPFEAHLGGRGAWVPPGFLLGASIGETT